MKTVASVSLKLVFSFLIILSFPLTSLFGTYDLNVDSLKNALREAEQLNDPESVSEIYALLGEYYVDQYEYEKAIEYLENVAQQSAYYVPDAVFIHALYLLGIAYDGANKNDFAIETFEKLMKISAKSDGEYLALAHFEISKVYQSIGENEKAYQHQIKCLELREEARDTSGQMKSLYQIGTIFFYQNNLELAKEYYQRTQKLAEKTKDQIYMYNSLAALGSTYQSMGKLQEAVSYTQKALERAGKMDYKIGLAYSYANMGENFFILAQYDSAKHYFLNSLKLAKEIQDDSALSFGHRLLGKTNLKLGESETGLKNLQTGLDIAKRINDKSRILESYMDLAKAFEESDNPAKSNFYLNAFIDLKDSVVNEMTLEKMSGIQSQYEILKRENEISARDREIDQLHKQVLSGGILLLILLLFGILWLYKKQKRNNLLLEEKNNEIEKQNRQLERSNADLQQFAYIASHDLKEPLRNIGSYASLISRRYKDKMDEECMEFFMYIQNGISKMYLLLNDVLDFSKLDYIPVKSEFVDTQEIVNRVALSLDQQIRDKKAKVYVSDLPNIKANDIHLSQLFQNLISNGLKFSNGRIPEIKISCETENNDSKHIFSVSDNGIGFDMAYKDKIFEMFQRLDKNHSEGTGVGLAICKKIVQQYGGDIWAESEPNKGSTFFFSMPLNN